MSLCTPRSLFSRCVRSPFPRTYGHRRNQQLYSRTSSSTSPSPLDLPAIDKKWQQRWDSARNIPAVAVKATEAEKNTAFYVLPMFPYPSGNLHLGHFRVYTISDVLARHARMCGRSVIHPMGWDAFGLPAENAAIERGVEPSAWTAQNIALMRKQLDAMGGAWDWDRELAACDPEFYKHTQRIFLMLHEAGLAYQAESVVNFDPVDKTVLANEQVDAYGRSWRSGAKVERVRLRQWFLRIKDFQEDLLRDLDVLAEDAKWPERVLAMQRNWLGKSQGAKVRFKLEITDDKEAFELLEVFTTRLDTLFGVQYLALSLSHPVVLRLAEKNVELKDFIDSSAKLPPESKAGFLLREIQGVNPASYLSGPTTKVQQPVPIFAAPYVLEDYGSGAVMGVPGHDARDHAFWRQNKGSQPILTVVKPLASESPASSYMLPGVGDEAFIHKGILTMASGQFGGLASDEAIQAILTKLQEDGHFAEVSESWRLRDWLVSRQRYWGTPIPIIHCDSCGAMPVPVSDLPVLLPKLEPGQLTGRGGNPLTDNLSWLNVPCPNCGSAAERETDTMDTFMDSSWYFFRFADPLNGYDPISPAAADARLPVDIYVGGVEHAILHLLYARFISKFLATTSLWPSGGGAENRGEPFRRLISQGMVHGKTYSDPSTGRFLRPCELDFSVPAAPPIVKASGQPAAVTFEKMSKSKHNGVDPLATILRYGADATRAHMLFAAPVADVLEWREDRIIGIQRWFQKLHRICTGTLPSSEAVSSNPTDLHERLQPSSPAARLWLLALHTTRSVGTALSRTLALNTAVSDLTKLTNALATFHSLHDQTKSATLDAEVRYHTTSMLLRLLAPIAPAFSSECWEVLHRSIPAEQMPAPLLEQTYPEVDEAAIEALGRGDRLVCAVQVDGRVKFAVELEGPPEELMGDKGDDSRDWVVAQVLGSVEGGRWFGEGGKVNLERDVKDVYIIKGGKTVNFVLNEKRRLELKERGSRR